MTSTFEHRCQSLIQFFVAAVAVDIDFVAVELCRENCERCGYHPVPYSRGSQPGVHEPQGGKNFQGVQQFIELKIKNEIYAIVL